MTDLQSRIRWNAFLPPAVVAVLGAGAVGYVLLASSGGTSAGTLAVLAAAGVAAALTVVIAVVRAGWVTSEVQRAVNAAQATRRRQLDLLRASLGQSQTELGRLLDRVRHGERPSPVQLVSAPPDADEQMVLLYDSLNWAHHAAQVGMVQAAQLVAQAGPVGNVEVFVDFSRRLQSLVHRAIRELDDLERKVEDPDLLNGLFQVDHLATRIRRHAENLAVLGGADSRRQWTTPQALTEVLRSAIAEVEHYSRVKLVPPIEGTLQGHAIADVIHLIAELIENATTFSAPHTDVLLRVQPVTAGLVVEVEDRGLGMTREEQARVNALLVDPNQVDLAELLRDGRLGLYVVSMIARRHGIRVELQTNIFGGIQAIIIVPHPLLGPTPEERTARAGTPAVVRREPVAAVAAPRVEALPAPSAPVAGTGPVVPTFVTLPEAAGAAGTPVVVPAPTGSPTPPPPPPAPVPGQRPPLPQRVGQTHLAPELRHAPAPRPPDAEHDPQLMAVFQRGFGEAENEPEDPDDTHRIS